MPKKTRKAKDLRLTPAEKVVVSERAEIEILEILKAPTSSAATRDQFSQIILNLKKAKLELDKTPLKKVPTLKIADDFKGTLLSSAKSAQIFDKLKMIESLPIKGGLDMLSGAYMDAIKEAAPKTLPDTALPPGAKGAILALPNKPMTVMVRLAATELYGGSKRILWDDGINQLIVELGKITLRPRNNRIDVTVPVICDQTESDMVIPFATSGESRNSGMILATSERPIGEKLVGEIWGNALIALSHNTLISVLTSLAAASGQDKSKDRLVARAIFSRDGQMSLETEARSRFSSNLTVKGTKK